MYGGQEHLSEQFILRHHESDGHSNTCVSLVKNRRKSISALLLITIVLTSSCTIIILRGKGSNGNSDPSPDPSRPSIPRAPYTLSDTCSRENVENPSGRELCVEVCAPAACCSDGSCNDIQECASYLPCQILPLTDPVNKIVLAPTKLITACSRENVEETEGGKVECEELCAPSSCCLNPVENPIKTCFLEYPVECASFAPCEILDLIDPSAQVPLAPTNINEVCNHASISSDKTPCEEACDPATCCNPVGDGSNEICLEQNFLACASYAVCANLLVVD